MSRLQSPLHLATQAPFVQTVGSSHPGDGALGERAATVRAGVMTYYTQEEVRPSCVRDVVHDYNFKWVGERKPCREGGKSGWSSSPPP